MTTLLLLWSVLRGSLFSEVLQSASVSSNTAYNGPYTRINSEALAKTLLRLKNVFDDFLRGVTNGEFNVGTGFYPFVVDRNTTVCVAHGADENLVGENTFNDILACWH